MRVAAAHVWQALTDGKLEARGRKPGQMHFEAIPSTHWRSSSLHMIKDNVTLWKMILIPTGGAEFSPDGTVTARNPASKERTDRLATYDSILVRARQFESLWPRKNKDVDARRKVFLRKAKKAGADPAEIAKLSQDNGSPSRIALWIVAVLLLLLLLFIGLAGHPELCRRPV
jgi:hypothetical protein